MGGAYFTKDRIYEMLEIEPVMTEGSVTVFRDNYAGGQVAVHGEIVIDRLVAALKSHRAQHADSEKISRSIDAMRSEAMLKTIDTLKFKIVVLKEQLSSAMTQVDVMRREINNL